jgi:hypothetical protein
VRGPYAYFAWLAISGIKRKAVGIRLDLLGRKRCQGQWLIGYQVARIVPDTILCPIGAQPGPPSPLLEPSSCFLHAPSNLLDWLVRLIVRCRCNPSMPAGEVPVMSADIASFWHPFEKRVRDGA